MAAARASDLCDARRAATRDLASERVAAAPRPKARATKFRLSPAAYRQITRPLIRPDGSFDRRKITADAAFRFHEARRFREPISWSKAMKDAWGLAHRQIDLATSFDARPLPLAA